MTTIQQEITDKTKLSEITVGGLKKIIQEMLDEKLYDIKETLFLLEQTLPDPDEGKPLKPEFEASLDSYLEQPEARRKQGKTLAEIAGELGLDD